MAVWPATAIVRWIAAAVLTYYIVVPFGNDLRMLLHEEAVAAAPESRSSEEVTLSDGSWRKPHAGASKATKLTANGDPKEVEKPIPEERRVASRSNPTFPWAYAIRIGSVVVVLGIALWAVVSLLRLD